MHPQTLDRLTDFTDLDDVAKNQLAFAPGITRIDDQIHILAIRKFENFPEFGLRLLDGVEGKSLGNGRQNIEFPWKPPPVRAHRHPQFDQVADGRSDDRAIVFKMNFAPGADLSELPQLLAQRLGKVVHDGRLFCNDECFSHGGG